MITDKQLLIFLVVPSEDTYFLSEFGGLCSNQSALDVTDVDECRYSLSNLQTLESEAIFNSEESLSSWPKGCLIYGIYSMKAIFNNHQNGTENKWSRQVCKGKAFIIGFILHFIR